MEHRPTFWGAGIAVVAAFVAKHLWGAVLDELTESQATVPIGQGREIYIGVRDRDADAERPDDDDRGGGPI